MRGATYAPFVARSHPGAIWSVSVDLGYGYHVQWTQDELTPGEQESSGEAVGEGSCRPGPSMFHIGADQGYHLRQSLLYLAPVHLH